MREGKNYLVCSKFPSGSPIPLCEPWGPPLICKTSKNQGTCPAARSASPSAPQLCETETRSGGRGKDTQLGKLGTGWTSLAARPFSFGQAPCPYSSAVSPAVRRSLLARISACLGEPADPVLSCSGVTRTDWNLAVENGVPSWHVGGTTRTVPFVAWGMRVGRQSLSRWTGVRRMCN